MKVCIIKIIKYIDKISIKLWYLYLLFLIVFVVIKFNGNVYNLIDRMKHIQSDRSLGYWNVNLAPLRTILPYLNGIKSDYAFLNIVGNIICYIPLGFLIPVTFRTLRSFWKVTLFSFVIIFTIESLQFLLLLGCFDVDDIMLDMLSAIVGYFFFICLLQFCRKVKLISNASAGKWPMFLR